MAILPSPALEEHIRHYLIKHREKCQIEELIIQPLSHLGHYLNPRAVEQARTYCVKNHLPVSRIYESSFRNPPFRIPEDLWLHHIHGKLTEVSVKELRHNPYLKRIRHLPPTSTAVDDILLAHTRLPAHSMQIINTSCTPEQGLIPQIGYYTEEFSFPVVSEGGRVWMSIAPSEINTMAEPIRQAHGRVLVFGCGLGYYPFMVSRKKEVSSVTVIEKNPKIIQLYKKYLEPLLNESEKIHIIEADAFNWLDQASLTDYDFAFADIWQSADDGRFLYSEFLRRERNHPELPFSYWIEDMILGSLSEEAGIALVHLYHKKPEACSNHWQEFFFREWAQPGCTINTPEDWDRVLHPGYIRQILKNR